MENEQPKSQQQPAAPVNGGGLAAPTLLAHRDTTKELAMKAAEVWPAQYWYHEVTSRVVANGGLTLWSGVTPEKINIDALKAAEETLLEEGLRPTIGREYFAPGDDLWRVTWWHQENDNPVAYGEHADEGAARLKAALAYCANVELCDGATGRELASPTGSDAEQPENPPCWCGVENPYYADSKDGLDATCGGSGVLKCYCGGDLCVCHWHGEVECFGCVDCEPEDDECYDD